MTRVAVNRTVTAQQSTPVTAPPAPPLPTTKRTGVEVVRVPALNGAISDLQAIVGMELTFYRRMRAQDIEKPLTESQARIIASHARTVVTLDELDRRRGNDNPFSTLTDEQLLTLMVDAVKSLKAQRESE